MAGRGRRRRCGDDVPETHELRGARRPRAWPIAAAVFAFAWLLYANTLGNDFVWDDRTLVVENAELTTLDWPTVERLFSSHYWEFAGKRAALYRPVSALSFHVDHRLHGKDPLGYHLTNTLLNAAVCELVFLFVREMFGVTSLAVVTALLFASLPLHTENVAWVSGRTDLIATLLVLAALLAYVAWRRRGAWWRLGLSVSAFAAAVLAKESALVLAPLIAVLELGPFPRLRRQGEPGFDARRLALTSAAFLSVAALFFVVRRAVVGAGALSFTPFATGVADTAALALSILAHYCYQLAFPFVLNAESEFPVPGTLLDAHALAGLALAASFAWILARWRRRGEVVLGVAILGIGITPVLNVLPITEVSAERFLYFPSLGYCLLAGTVAAGAIGRWRLQAIAVVAMVVAAFGVRTTVRNADWRDESTLFRKTVEASPDNARAHLNLANAYHRSGRHLEALAEYRRALDIDPGYAAAWSGSAGAYRALHEPESALQCMNQALAIEPSNANFHNSLGTLHAERNDLAAAAGSFERALELDAGHSRARFNLGLALYTKGDYAGASRALADLPHKDTEFVQAYFYLAAAESRLGNARRAGEYSAAFLERYDRHDELRARAREILSGAR
jgi:tetratricopeptide (TPR) repeat protein